MIGTISLVILIMWGLFIFGVASDSDIFKFLAGCGLLLMSVWTMSHGLEGVNNFVTQGISVITIGVGALAIFSPLLNLGSNE